MGAFLTVLSYIGVFILGGCFGLVLTALLVANDPSRGHPL